MPERPEAAHLPVSVAGSALSAGHARRERADYVAQILGQGGRRRGLRGGPPVLAAARAVYLETEYAGGGDRRAPLGLRVRTAI